jgi:hypothetical protein
MRDGMERALALRRNVREAGIQMPWTASSRSVDDFRVRGRGARLRWRWRWRQCVRHTVLLQRGDAVRGERRHQLSTGVFIELVGAFLSRLLSDATRLRQRSVLRRVRCPSDVRRLPRKGAVRTVFGAAEAKRYGLLLSSSSSSRGIAAHELAASQPLTSALAKLGLAARIRRTDAMPSRRMHRRASAGRPSATWSVSFVRRSTSDRSSRRSH